MVLVIIFAGSAAIRASEDLWEWVEVSEEKKALVIVAAHKQYRMPADSLYLPLHVGAQGKTNSDGVELDFGYIKDNTGDNISELNPGFCELTGLYWAWKNLDAEYIGLVHYRRHFGMQKARDPWDGVLTLQEIEPYLGKIKVFVPKKRNYYIETLYSHYEHTHYIEHLEETRRIISEKYPAYLDSYDRVVHKRCGYMFNMMIMQKKYMNSYCSWLFDILFELKNRVDDTELSTFQKRFYGRVSEIIFNVWLDYQLQSGELQKEEIMELLCLHMEKVNWWKKGTAFLQARFLGKKYESGF